MTLIIALTLNSLAILTRQRLPFLFCFGLSLDCTLAASSLLPTQEIASPHARLCFFPPHPRPSLCGPAKAKPKAKKVPPEPGPLRVTATRYVVSVDSEDPEIFFWGTPENDRGYSVGNVIRAQVAERAKHRTAQQIRQAFPGVPANCVSNNTYTELNESWPSNLDSLLLQVTLHLQLHLQLLHLQMHLFAPCDHLSYTAFS